MEDKKFTSRMVQLDRLSSGKPIVTYNNVVLPVAESCDFQRQCLFMHLYRIYGVDAFHVQRQYNLHTPIERPSQFDRRPSSCQSLLSSIYDVYILFSIHIHTFKRCDRTQSHARDQACTSFHQLAAPGNQRPTRLESGRSMEDYTFPSAPPPSGCRSAAD